MLKQSFERRDPKIWIDQKKFQKTSFTFNRFWR